MSALLAATTLATAVIAAPVSAASATTASAASSIMLCNHSERYHAWLVFPKQNNLRSDIVWTGKCSASFRLAPGERFKRYTSPDDKPHVKYEHSYTNYGRPGPDVITIHKDYRP
ncbi:hypothetical protein [Nonomuraea lactucae]|uniref:hypothetical protein n=1 Tax=Nonomuraea lactucae TaxID=2249762 RepID=UPI0013B401F4|nr:hypothetical protein [Nonomuraea lactucae]